MKIKDRIKELRRVSAADLIPNPKNWRKHPKAQQDAMRGLLAQVGYADAVLARETDDGLMLIDGHLRAETTPDAKVPVLILDVTEAEADLILATHDPVAAMAETDDELLNELMSGIKLESEAVQAMMDEVADIVDEPTEGLTDPDDVPDEVDPICKTGDLWSLGEHRLLCGDSTKREDVERLMDGEKADMVFTDPPYGMNLNTEYDNLGCEKKRNMDGKRYKPVIGDDSYYNPSHIFDIFGYCSEIFLWGADYYCWDILKDGSWIVWDKRNDNTGGMIGNEFELCWSKSRHKKLVFRKYWAGLAAREMDEVRTHPTQKPIALAEWFFEKWGDGKSLIVDLFLGSGSTIIACEKTNRKCYGMELDPHYCDVIIKRWEDFTGRKAEKIA